MNKKVYIVLIVILITLSIGIYTWYYMTDSGEEDNNPNGEIDNPTLPTDPEEIQYKMLVIDDISNWGYYDERWIKLDPEEIEDNQFTVYVDHKYYGSYNLKYGTIWNLFDNNDTYIEYTGSLFAYSENFNVNVPNYEKTTVGENEIREISTILNRSIDTVSFSIDEVVNIDLDFNGVVDKIVNVSNLDSVDAQQYYFNLCYIVLNGEIQTLILDNVDIEDLLAYPIYEINYLLQYDNNNYYSIILQEGYFSNVGETQNNLYNLTDGNYSLIFSD